MRATDQRDTIPGRLAWLPGAAALLAFLACNGTIVLITALSFFGITVAINPLLQAVAITFFALLTTAITYLGFRKHRVVWPLVLSVVGALLIIGTMYTFFSKIVESLGLVLLVAAAIWNWRSVRACRTAGLTQ